VGLLSRLQRRNAVGRAFQPDKIKLKVELTIFTNFLAKLTNINARFFNPRADFSCLKPFCRALASKIIF